MALASPRSILVLSLKNTGLSTAAYPESMIKICSSWNSHLNLAVRSSLPVANDRFMITTFFDSQTRKTGIPAMLQFGSSIAAEFT